jgi:DNA-binding transcriptional MerR regulator
MDGRWRIDELQALAEKALDASSYEGPGSKRVRAVPDARTIRYYTTIGLIDRPAAMQGRTAYYDRRHVLQLVCIKRLQAAGLSLAEVQRKLTGATSRRLAELAELPDGFWEDLPAKQEATKTRDRKPAASAATNREAFWLAPPIPASHKAPIEQVPPAPVVSVRLPVAPDVWLELAGPSAANMNSEVAGQLRPALSSLASELVRLGLISPLDSES